MKEYLKITSDPKARWANKRAARAELKLLRNEIRKRETNVVTEILRSCDVILCTNVGAASRLLNSIAFDVVIIDEAAQALEASCWIPILRGTKLVLVGDHKQLPPTIKSHVAARRGLDVTLFDRALKRCGDDASKISRMLSVQYRMHRDISDWASREMYHNQLKPAKCVEGHLLQHLDHVVWNEEEEEVVGSNKALLLIDTAGCDMEEGLATKSGSKFNEGEARLVQHHGM